jgi:zinc transporter 1/2/3
MNLLKLFLISVSAAKAIAAASATSAAPSSITGCHTHESEIFCFNTDGHEVLVYATATPTSGTPAQYTGCHSHGAES